ncbi:MAG: poly[(R)-3-hydroxyalkanoate] polymerase subunit PhaC [Thermodesulfobacteriota bacterium]|nr:poly[(R)-3-hydroxyalkanoate] polymerase subunit PhaC [Thermodesulfobacteriota bacterium]
MDAIKNTAHASIDSFIHARQARFTMNLSPVTQVLAFLDWFLNLADSPGTQYRIIEDFKEKSMTYWTYLCRTMINNDGEAEKPIVVDSRFKAEDWQQCPYNLIHQAFLLSEQWWHNATTGIPGFSSHNQNVVSSMVRQLMDICSPANALLTNPVLTKITEDQKGQNLVRGWKNMLDDWRRQQNKELPVGTENFKPGEKVAITPGKVVLRNHLIELIQYTPATKTVCAEPLLIVPAWIMKYYILDLSPHNSLVKYLVDKGHTVFMVSWKNPTAEDRNLGMGDYQFDGVMAAINAILKILPDQKIHTAGYWTMLAIVAATMAREGDARLGSMTLLAAQTDFTEAGELTLFIDENQVNYLTDIMFDRGYLDTKEMAGAFQLLRANDLLWSRIIQDYLMGKRRLMTDLMSWNADATRMPHRMHSQYLRRLFLDNDLFQGRYKVDGQNIVIRDIHVPVFIVSTVQDHVAPWRSVHKFLLTSDAETVTFVLTSGGHNAGIISEPQNTRRTYQMSTHREGEKYINTDRWLEEAPTFKGSWWLPWEEWLTAHSTDQTAPPEMGSPGKGLKPRGDAPGTYVLQT